MTINTFEKQGDDLQKELDIYCRRTNKEMGARASYQLGTLIGFLGITGNAVGVITTLKAFNQLEPTIHLVEKK